MMKITPVVFLLLGIALASPAQRKPRVVKAKRTPIVQHEETNTKLYQQMLPATAKVMFFDSVVVDKHNFMAYLPVSKEIGTLAVNANADMANQMGSYQNEFGDRRILAQAASIRRRWWATSGVRRASLLTSTPTRTHIRTIRFSLPTVSRFISRPAAPRALASAISS